MIQAGKANDDEPAREVQRLRAELWNRDEAAALEAVRGLSRLRSPASCAALCEALGREGRVGAAATRALELVGQPALVYLLAALRHPNATRRWHAAKALCAIAPTEAVPALIAALRDEDAAVRWEAVHGLAAIGEPSLVPLLRVLCRAELSSWLSMGAERVLRRLAPWFPNLKLSRLIWMLDHTQAHVSVPLEAHRLLTQLAAEGRGTIPTRAVSTPKGLRARVSPYSVGAEQAN